MKINNISNYSIQNKYRINSFSFMGPKHYMKPSEFGRDVFIISQKTYEMEPEEAQNGIINIVLDNVDKKAQGLTPKENLKIFKEGNKLLKKGMRKDYQDYVLRIGRIDNRQEIAFGYFNLKTGIPEKIYALSADGHSKVCKIWDYSKQGDCNKNSHYSLKYTEYKGDKIIDRYYTDAGYCDKYIETDTSRGIQDIYTGSYATINPKKGYNFKRQKIKETDEGVVVKPLIEAKIRIPKEDSEYIEYDEMENPTTYRHDGNMWVKV